MVKRTTKELCALCKGARRLCGASVCPILVKRALQHRVRGLQKTELGAYSEWLLVGEYGYPRLRYGPISAISSVPWDPEIWASRRLDFSEILKIRALTLFSFERRQVSSPPSIYEPIGEAIASEKPIGVEIILRRPPKMGLRLDADIPPFGGMAPLKGLRLEENPRISRSIESLILDRVKASRAVEALYERGLSVYYIQKIFSAGFLGIEERRRIVPTRWGITAVDSILGDMFRMRIRWSPSIPKAELYSWEYLGNIYHVILIPSDYWSMEMYEVWLPNSVWLRGVGKPVIIRNYEGADGKPVKMDGGYYAIRMAVLEHLSKINRKAMALAIRIITPQYIAPVGNWQIRESIRLALRRGPNAKGDVEELIGMLKEKKPTVLSTRTLSGSFVLRRLKMLPITYFLGR